MTTPTTTTEADYQAASNRLSALALDPVCVCLCVSVAIKKETP